MSLANAFRDSTKSLEVFIRTYQNRPKITLVPTEHYQRTGICGIRGLYGNNTVRWVEVPPKYLHILKGREDRCVGDILREYPELLHSRKQNRFMTLEETFGNYSATQALIFRIGTRTDEYCLCTLTDSSKRSKEVEAHVVMTTETAGIVLVRAPQ